MNLESHLESHFDSLAHAAEVIRSGGVVAYPTEACFGLGCDPRNAAAVRRILRIKRRSPAKGLIIIADRLSRLRLYVDMEMVCAARHPRPQVFDSWRASWPGRHTWLMPAGKHASRWLRGSHRTVAVRVTAHREAAGLCRLARTAIVSTSANRSRRRMLRDAGAVWREFGDEVDCIVAGRIGNANAPSIIRHFETGEVVRG